jgi:hypothetical protein
MRLVDPLIGNQPAGNGAKEGAAHDTSAGKDHDHDGAFRAKFAGAEVFAVVGAWVGDFVVF